jgi:hypothetical protein
MRPPTYTARSCQRACHSDGWTHLSHQAGKHVREREPSPSVSCRQDVSQISRGHELSRTVGWGTRYPVRAFALHGMPDTLQTGAGEVR